MPILEEDELPPMPTYQERYCAFVDILGFSTLVERLSNGTTSFEALRDLLRIIHEPPTAERITSFEGGDFHAQSISDAVCISTNITEAGLNHLFYVLQLLTMRMLAQGFFVRGAVVKGHLYHDDKMVFGEALIRAYNLEQNVVVFPRVMVTSPVYADLPGADIFIGWASKHTVVQAEDGPRYLDVLQEIPATIGSTTIGEAPRLFHLDRFEGMADQIQRRLGDSFDNPKHFEKVQWFAKYWNRVARPLGVKHIVGPGVDPTPAVWG
jgi:hypothetical protein